MTRSFSGGCAIAAASLLLFVAACAGGDGRESAGTSARGGSASTGETSSSSGTTADGTTTGEPEASAELEQIAAAQQCLDAWHDRENDPARASFLLASGGRGLRRVSVGFAKDDACLISFAGTNGLLVQVIEVNSPSGQFTGLWPPGRLENFDPSPVGWNASANAHGYVTLRRAGSNSPPQTDPSDETTAFPNDNEDIVLEATPSEGWQCQRSDEQTRGAVVGVICDPTPRISVRYELFPRVDALDDAYWGYFKTMAQNDVAPGSNCVRNVYGEGWLGRAEEKPIGRLFCFKDAQRRPALVWKSDSSRILAFASGRRRDELVRWLRTGGGWLG